MSNNVSSVPVLAAGSAVALRRALLLSLAVHLALTFVAFRIVRFTRVRFVPREVYTVNLLDIQQPKTEPPRQAVQPPPVEKEPEIAEPEPEPEPEPKEELAPPPEKPKKKPEPKKKKEVPRTDPKPVAEPQGEPSDEPAAPAETGEMSLVEDFPFAFYIRQMKYKIASNWRIPGSKKEERVCWVSFKVDRNGRIFDIGIESSSGNLLFDQAAERAVVMSNPLPPLPDGFKKNQLGVSFAFSYVEGQ